MVIVVSVVMGRGHCSHREGSLKVITERERERVREKGERRVERKRGMVGAERREREQSYDDCQSEVQISQHCIF